MMSVDGRILFHLLTRPTMIVWKAKRKNKEKRKKVMFVYSNMKFILVSRHYWKKLTWKMEIMRFKLEKKLQEEISIKQTKLMEIK